jgi:FkbM family methyltransferase
MHIIDIGANIGDYSLWFAKLVGAEGRIWAFEPSPATFDLLRRNIRANGLCNIVAVNKAVAETTGSSSFFLSAKQSGCASMFEHNVPAVTGRVEVETVALDEFIEQVGIDKLDIVKIDAQGAEWQILRGASKCWRRFRPLCLLEFWPDGLTHSRADPADLIRFMRATWPSMHLVRWDSDPAQLQVASDQHILDYCGEHGGYCDLLLR